MSSPVANATNVTPSPAQLAVIIATEIQTDLMQTNYIQVASLILLLYDHGLTLQQEIDFVWRGSHTRSWPRFVFLAGRYAPLLVSIINTIALMHPHFSTVMYDITPQREYGTDWLLFEGWIGFIFFAAVQIISQLRLWAVYRRADVLIAMGIVMILGLIAMGLLEGLGYRGVAAGTVTTTVVGGIRTCGPGVITSGAMKTIALPRYVAFFWIPPIIIETLSVILVASKALQHYRSGGPKQWAGSRFMYSIARYSVIYFVGVLAVYIANFIIWIQFQVPRLELLIPLTFSLPCVMGNRMLLDLRAVFYADHNLVPGQDDFNMQVVRQDTSVTIQAENFYSEFDSFFGEGKSTKNELLSHCCAGMTVETETMVKTETIAKEDLERQFPTGMNDLNESIEFEL